MPTGRRRKKRGCGCFSLFVLLGVALIAVMLGVGSFQDPPSGDSGEPAPPVESKASSTSASQPPEVSPPPTGMFGNAKAALDSVSVVTGKVIGVADGDSITLLSPAPEPVKIRLEGIDAPEASQEFGNKSKQALGGLVAGETVTARITGKDRYGRSLAWIEVDGLEVNRRMVADGWAWQYLEYNQDRDLSDLQQKARAGRLGLWGGSSLPMPPWEFRQLGRTPSTGGETSSAGNRGVGNDPAPPQQQRAREGKYWINSNGVRHNRSCRWYGQTKRGRYSDEAEGRGCGNCGG